MSVPPRDSPFPSLALMKERPLIALDRNQKKKPGRLLPGLGISTRAPSQDVLEAAIFA
jgi:hypothetical protein